MNALPGHDCRTVPEEGLAGKKNGELLHSPEIQRALRAIRPGELVKVG
jgi:hypothetical protein